MNLYKLLNLLINYLKNNFVNNQKFDLIFQNACENGNIILVKQILNKHPDINIESNNNRAFVLACFSGNLEIVKLLYDKRPNMNLITYNYFSIKSCAIYGNLKVFTWLYDKLRLNLDNIEICLELSIISGNINIAKFLYNNNSNLDLSRNNNIYTECACRHNHLDIVKWLYNLIGNDIFKFDQNENYLIESSRKNNLSIVYWLFNTKPEINIFINNDEAFRNACNNDSIEVAKWFNKLNPSRYYLEIEDHVITHFNVVKTYLAKKRLKQEWRIKLVRDFDGTFDNNTLWHSDIFFSTLKVFIYLNSVPKEQDVFQYVETSHVMSASILDLHYRYSRNQCRQPWPSLDEVSKLGMNIFYDDIPKNTLILSDTRGIHRRHPKQFDNSDWRATLFCSFRSSPLTSF